MLKYKIIYLSLFLLMAGGCAFHGDKVVSNPVMKKEESTQSLYKHINIKNEQYVGVKAHHPDPEKYKEKKEQDIKKEKLVKEFGPGELDNVFEKWAKAWGYKVSYIGSDDIEDLFLQSPLNLKGENFATDLRTISMDLNNGRNYSFRFSVFEKNNVIELETIKK